jgi:hypothetical protein
MQGNGSFVPVLPMKRILLLLSCTSLFGCLYAQESAFGNWLIYFGNKQIDTRWNIHNEVQYRTYDWGGDLEQLMLRTGLGCNLTEKNNNLLLGYGYILSENYLDRSEDKVSVKEHRIFQQFITRHAIGSISVQHRYRFEQRFIEDDYRMRLRYFLAINVPLSKRGLVNGSWYGSAYNEIFVNKDRALFDRNRVYAGLGYRIADGLRMELGYMNQIFNSGSRDQLNIVTFLSDQGRIASNTVSVSMNCPSVFS